MVVRHDEASADVTQVDGQRRCQLEAGLRAWLMLPLSSTERVSGAFIIGSFAPHVYGL